MDLWVVDIRRFSAMHKDHDWVRLRTVEACAKHYTIAWPHEEYVSGRPLLKSPLYDRMREHNACFGSKLGWERPNWFAPVGVQPKDEYSFGRQNWFAAVGDEHRQVADPEGPGVVLRHPAGIGAAVAGQALRDVRHPADGEPPG